MRRLWLVLSGCVTISPRFEQDVATTFAQDDMRRLETSDVELYYPAEYGDAAKQVAARATECLRALRGHHETKHDGSKALLVLHLGQLQQRVRRRPVARRAAALGQPAAPHSSLRSLVTSCSCNFPITDSRLHSHLLPEHEEMPSLRFRESERNVNRIIESHLEGFKEANGLQDLAADVAFEHFLNFSVGHKHTGVPPDTGAITTDDPDAGIDGVLFLIDNELVTTVDECHEILQRSKRNVEARLVFTQATIAESFSKAKLVNFGTGVYDFLQKKPNQPHGTILSEYHKVFDVIVKNANKIVGGKPECDLYFASTGRYNQDAEIEAAVQTIQTQLNSLGLFAKVAAHILDCDSLLKLWLDCTQTISASVDVIGQMISLPKSSKIQEAYFGLVLGRELVAKLLANGDNELRTWVFNENVRSYLGAESAVNAEIGKTLSAAETRARFALLNNGITIVSPDIRVQGTTISLNGYQIVNGCQTSNMLFTNRELLADEVAVAVKFIEAEDPDVVAEIVRATNKQTKVEDSQFLALEPVTKRIEEYFKTYTQDEQRIYFERRFRQYVGAGVPQIRIFDIKSACRAVSAMFISRPDLAMRYPNQMFVELQDQLFDEKNKEIVYYTACLGLYRINLLISSGRLPSNFRRMKWHLLTACRVTIGGAKVPVLASGDVEKYCKSMITVFSQANPLLNKGFERAVEYVKTISDASRDKLTKKTAGSEIRDALIKKP